jgi:hypothetical protein
MRKAIQLLSVAIAMSSTTATMAQPGPIPPASNVYVGTQNTGSEPQTAKVYRYSANAQNNWVDLTPSGFDGVQEVSAVLSLAVYHGELYAGVQTAHGYGGGCCSGGGGSGLTGGHKGLLPPGGTGCKEYGTGQVWRYEGNGDWELVGELGTAVNVLLVYNNKLYAAVTDVEDPDGNVGWLYRCTTCDGTDWVDMPGQHSSNGFFSGIVSAACGDPEIFIGDLYADDFWRYAASTGQVELADSNSGSCIWDFAPFNDTLYASAWGGSGPVYELDIATCPDVPLDFVPTHYTDLTNWAAESFLSKLWIGSGDPDDGDPQGAVLQSSTDGSNFDVEHTWATSYAYEGVTALARQGNQFLWIGLGSKDGTESCAENGAGEVWRYNGSAYTRIGPADFFQGGVQTILVAAAILAADPQPLGVSGGSLISFLTSWSARQAAADQNGDGVTDGQDFMDFLERSFKR